MNKSKAYRDLKEAFAQSGCPICRLEADLSNRLLDGLVYEQVNDPGLRNRIRRAKGFCQRHSWMLDRSGASLGVAIIYRDLVRDMLASLDGARRAYLAPPSSEPSLGALFRRGLQRPRHDKSQAITAATCPICVRVEEIRKTWFSMLLDDVRKGGDLSELYSRSSDGICRPHFEQILASARDRAAAEKLIGLQQSIWKALEHSLSEAIRKSDYRFKDEPLGEDGTAWLRAIAACAGEKVSERRS
jgi:hypothetical protein